jgi:hypothetical protein
MKRSATPGEEPASVRAKTGSTAEKFKEKAIAAFLKVDLFRQARIFSRKARYIYMLVYMGHKGSSLKHYDIEKQRKKYRCHHDMSRRK